jgi:hypothetical protein
VITFDPDRLARRRAELEEAMGAYGFWDDQAGAARISTEHSRIMRKLERYERLQGEYEDARELLALGEDEREIGESVAVRRWIDEQLQQQEPLVVERDGSRRRERFGAPAGTVVERHGAQQLSGMRGRKLLSV